LSGIRSLYAAAWMGIQHDLAWTTPALSLALRAVAPFASAMTVSIIYWFGSTSGGTVLGGLDPTKLAYILVGSTLYAHVASYAWVPTIAIAEGKNLSVFPHIYLTARSTAGYVAGRGISAFVISTITSIAALGVASVALASFLNTHVPLTVTPLSAAMLGVALVADIPAALGLGYFLGAYSLYASKFEWSLPGYVAGLLMVFSGALFPPTILPYPISAGATYLPFTQFIAAARVAMVPGLPGNYLYSLFLCTVGGVLLLAVSLWVYFLAEKKARKDGVIDRRFA
jgi:hypothetical protein